MIYKKNGKECILCKTRKKLIVATPEEKVRQNFINKLVDDFGVPLGLIDTEVPMSNFSKGKKGRADIIVYEYDEKEDLNFPLILVECKGPNVPLVDFVFEQAYNYNEILLAKLVIVTNGHETIGLIWEDKSGEYIEVMNIPHYLDLVLNENIGLKELGGFNHWVRPNHLDVNSEITQELIDFGIIGEDSSKGLYSFFVNLWGLLFDESKVISHLNLTDKKFINDGGIRFTTFGNASGGGFPGDYRYLILNDNKNDTHIVSISMLGKISAKNHPKYGNTNGYTMLLIAIDDFEKSHLSLELALDRFIQVKDNTYSIIHDGTLTVGKKGRVRNKEVIDFVQAKNPKLVRDNKIYLGTLSNTTELSWQMPDVLEFFGNIVDYALLRDEFRRTK